MLKACLRHEAKISVTLRGRDATWRMVADSPCAEWGGEGRIQSRTNEKGPTRPAPWFFFLQTLGRRRREADLPYPSSRPSDPRTRSDGTAEPGPSMRSAAGTLELEEEQRCLRRLLRWIPDRLRKLQRPGLRMGDDACSTGPSPRPYWEREQVSRRRPRSPRPHRHAGRSRRAPDKAPTPAPPPRRRRGRALRAPLSDRAWTICPRPRA